MSQDESFLQRWSRRKQAQEQAPESTDASTEPTAPLLQDLALHDELNSELPTEAATKSALESPRTSQAPETSESAKLRVLTDADMPPLESLDENSDYSLFFSEGVSAGLRKLALRKLFQAPRFNQRDGLDDYDHDYTQFASLGDTVTVDMKFQQAVDERRRREQPDEYHYLTEPNPRQVALDSLREYSAPATGMIEYHSQGRVLIMGAESALAIAGRLPESLQPHILLTSASFLARGQSIITELAGRTAQLSGWLGRFTLDLTAAESTPVSQLSADLVLDMNDEPLLTMAVKPPGYFYLAPKSDAITQEAVLAELTELIGHFAKPRFFDYDSSICVHGSSGIKGCTRCIDACPTTAIISIGEKIKVEPHFCQGGGTCATVCPSGAIRYHYPPLAFQVDQLRRYLKTYREVGGLEAVLLIHRAECEVDVSVLPSTILPFAVEELASVGAAFWLSALSFGATQVWLLVEDTTPELSQQALEQQLNMVQAMLSGMGYAPDCVKLVQNPLAAETALSAAPAQLEAFSPATYAGQNNKRQQWLAALDHLAKFASTLTEEIPLPAGAPFGRLKINTERCTLCMACATICPMQAIAGGVDKPQLRFFSANCVQCGLCATGCPEQAIDLEPILIVKREKRQQAITLFEQPAFHCIVCNQPFSNLVLVNKMLDKLKLHPMFKDERSLHRLQMCENCRVVDIVQDDEAMGRPLI